VGRAGGSKDREEGPFFEKEEVTDQVGGTSKRQGTATWQKAVIF
jgi:hypothetical protein